MTEQKRKGDMPLLRNISVLGGSLFLLLGIGLIQPKGAPLGSLWSLDAPLTVRHLLSVSSGFLGLLLLCTALVERWTRPSPTDRNPAPPWDPIEAATGISGETVILMADGTQQRVAEVKVGDEVLGVSAVGEVTTTAIEGVYGGGSAEDDER